MSDFGYGPNGVKHRHSFPCPKCLSGPSPVIVTRQTPAGETIRRRGCSVCGHRWFTVQEPEYLVPRGAVKWCGSDLRIITPEPHLPQ
jgi:hypothetical protein